MRLIKAKSDLKEFVNSLDDDSIALIPTMGALHEGHLSLIKKAMTLTSDIIVSIYINPSQFGPNEDLNTYPRSLTDDIAALDKLGVCAVFAPTDEEMYPQGFQTYVYNDNISKDLCGKSRPEHFQGVCTIVLKLINLVRPKWIVFGKKDYQQYKIIEQMISDLDLDTKIIAGELVRASNGMALSSRNQKLNECQKQIALNLFEVLQSGKELVSQGQYDPEQIVMHLRKKLMEIKGISLDYLEIRKAKDLTKSSPDTILDSILFGAIKVGSTRLIDNVPLS